MADVLTIDDLIADKKHSTFFAEVVTGKTGGVASGANISTSTNQVTGQVQKTLPQVLAELGMVVQAWTATSGGTLTNAAQVFLNNKVGSAGLGNYYAWSGTFPKTVTAGLDPAITAGFIQRSDARLRSELLSHNGVSLVNGAQWKTSVTVSEVGSLAAAVATGFNVDVDIDVTLTTNVTTVAENQIIRSAGGRITMTGSGAITLSSKYSQAHNLNIIANGNEYCIIESGENSLAYNCVFTGVCTNYILGLNAIKPSTLFCKAGPANVSNIPFVYENCTDFSHSNNILNEHNGFGVQARWCNGGNISSNKTKNALHTYSLSAVNGQTSYAFTVPSGGFQRWGFYIQDNVGCTARLVTSVTVVGTTATVVISEPTVVGIGAIAYLVGINALENYQVNSGCKNIRIENNFADGTGDSNVVIGADYHFDGSNWVLNPGAVVASDFPTDTIVSGNTLKNALYANITANNSANSTTITNNHCYHAGYCKDLNQVLDCNINCSVNSSILGNDCHSNQAVIMSRAGIAAIPTSMNNFYVGGEMVIIAANKFYGGFTQGDYQLAPTSLAATRRIGVNVEGLYKKYEPLITTILASSWSVSPASTNFWYIAASGSGWARDTSNQIIGGQCARTVGGSFVDCYPTFTADMAEGGIAKVSVKVKGTGYVDVVTNFSGGTSTTNTILVSESTWVTKIVYMSVKNFTDFHLHIGSNNSDIMYLQDATIEFLALKC